MLRTHIFLNYSDADEKAPRNEPKSKSKEIEESQTGPEHEYKVS